MCNVGSRSSQPSAMLCWPIGYWLVVFGIQPVRNTMDTNATLIILWSCIQLCYVFLYLLIFKYKHSQPLISRVNETELFVITMFNSIFGRNKWLPILWSTLYCTVLHLKTTAIILFANAKFACGHSWYDDWCWVMIEGNIIQFIN